MIREYGPIPLIPAAWTLTFLTVVYPGLDPYWIKHMHLFMVLFLGFFAVASWNEMQGEVMKTWRNIIAAGFIFTLVGTAGFYFARFQDIFSYLEISYWILAPASGAKITSLKTERFSKAYRFIAVSAFPAIAGFILGFHLKNEILLGTAFIIAGTSQALSIVLASKMDK